MELREEVRRHLGDLEPEKVLELRQGDHDGNAVGEPDDDRHRNEPHHLAELEDAHRHQQAAGQHRGDEQVGDAVALDNRVEQRNKGTRRPGDLDARASQDGHDQAADHRGDQTLLGLDARGNTESHGQRHRNARNRQAGADVGSEIAAPVAL